MKKTKFRFFKNTPLIDFQNTIHFSSNSERDDFFLNGSHYPELSIQAEDFNFIRDRSSLIIDVPYSQMAGVNYCTFKSDFEPTRFYAYVIDYEYLNDQAIRVNLLIDGIMTYTQGNVLETLPNLSIERQHLSRSKYESNIWELKNNDDILKTNTKRYFKTEKVLFNELIVLITASVDLKSDFGDQDNPNMKTSFGRKFDKITSPLNLYACDVDDFNKLMKALSEYPWISQNIKTMSLMPKVFMEDNLTKVNFSSGNTLSGIDYLYSVSGTRTNKTPLLKELINVSYTLPKLMQLFGLDPNEDKHLLRNEYTTTEIYNYSGGALLVDNGQLNLDSGLSYMVDLVTGYHNEVKLYIDRYRVEKGIQEGSYINDSLTFDTFDDMPMLIDTYGLSMAKTANQRQLTESKLLTNQVSSLTDSSANLKDRFMNAASLASNLSPTNLFGKFTDEYDYYRQQKAEQADMALEIPSISEQTNGNSFNIANNKFGIHIKYSKPTDSELNKIKKYYKLFGYQVNDQSNYLDKVNSMTVCNYVKFSGSWTIPGADVSIIEMMKAQFENGVRLWHNKNTRNPMIQNVLTNKIGG